MPALDAVGVPFVLQLQSTTDQCWEAAFSAAGLRRRTPEQLQAVSD